MIPGAKIGPRRCWFRVASCSNGLKEMRLSLAGLINESGELKSGLEN